MVEETTVVKPLKRRGRPKGRRFEVQRIVYLDRETDAAVLRFMRERKRSYSGALRDLVVASGAVSQE